MQGRGPALEYSNVRGILPGWSSAWRGNSQIAFCYRCRRTVQSTVRRTVGLETGAVCGDLVAAGWVCGCFLLPFCVDDFKDVHHFCPRCRIYLGTFTPY